MGYNDNLFENEDSFPNALKKSLLSIQVEPKSTIKNSLDLER